MHASIYVFIDSSILYHSIAYDILYYNMYYSILQSPSRGRHEIRRHYNMFSSVQFREPGARRRIGMCEDVLVRRFLLAAGLLPKIPKTL